MDQNRSLLFEANDIGRNTRKILPWVSVASGGALAVYGIVRRNWTGAAAATAGGLLVYGGVQMARQDSGLLRIVRSVTINRPIEEVYSFWHNFENFPKFMDHLDSVTVTSSRSSRWRARGPMKTSIEWEAEIVDEQPNQFIVWRSRPGAMIPNRGSVEFRNAPAFRGGTEIVVSLEYGAPGGRFGRAIAMLFGEEPEQQIHEDLRHFKQLMEAGEIPTTEGQPSGRRTAFVRMMDAVNEGKREQRERARHPQAV